MIIIINDDSVYVSWVRRHHGGFVLDTKRKATKRNTMLHRATCLEITKARTKRTRWTTGRRVKACSEDSQELVEWCLEQIGGEPKLCSVCSPANDDLLNTQDGEKATDDRQLTKLENDIVSAVVESAVIHLDNELDFQMTVGDVAEYLMKTPAQISSALRRLVAEEMLETQDIVSNTAPIPGGVRVFPTAISLCTVPAFAELGADELQRELNCLRT